MPTEIDAFLIIWARWSVYRMDSGLGYAHATTLHRCMTQGAAGAAIGQDYANRITPTNEGAERIDRLVAQLPENLKQVVKLEYLGRDSRKQHAKRLHLGVDAYCYRLRSAKAQLAAAL
jgi:DNA-directed RNA polymerase specialized sigma24 family protein